MLNELFLVFLFVLLPSFFCLFIFSSINKCYLQFFQQEEYDNQRFLRWWLRSRSFEKRTSLLALIFSFLFFVFTWSADFLITLLILINMLTLSVAARTNKPVSSKKPLVITARVKRIWNASLILQLLAFLLLEFLFVLFNLIGYLLSPLPYINLSILIIIQLSPLFIVLANLLLTPYENYTQKGYLNEAKDILQRYKPRVIGVTGSYGKTSMKHILSHILNSYAPTLATPGSVNTQMGITRIIRERLRPEHQYVIVEMGAYGIGSIQRLCDLTPPQVAIVTAVGLAHLERFKSVETIASAKSELPHALPPDGIAILNGDNPHCRAMADQISSPTYFYGQDSSQGPLHCRLLSTATTDQGTKCVFEYENKQHAVIMPVYGPHQAHNASGAFLAAARIGVPILSILATLQTLPQIEHRLVVNKGADGISIIDDAYNSNPDGFRNALEVLKILSGKRKILITPGMVELGSRHDEEHRNLAVIAAESCDIAVLVAPQRIEAFHEGLLQNGFPAENIHSFPNLQEARAWLDTILQPGDIVLFENDLPDLYETQTAFKLLNN